MRYWYTESPLVVSVGYTVQAEDFEVSQHWVGTPALAFVGSLILDLLLQIAEPQFPQLKNGTNNIYLVSLRKGKTKSAKLPAQALNHVS